MIPLLLASASPRRRQMLAWLGLEYSILPADIDESPLPGELPDVYVLRLAESKAHAVAQSAAPGQIVLAADTTVTLDGALLGKPRDAADAEAMLWALRDRAHWVYTALALCDPEKQLILTDLCASPVPMRAYTAAEVQAYVASGDPLDKAGAYAIQNGDFHPVVHFKHCQASVMGLPLCHVQRSLARLGISLKVDVPAICQQNLRYICPIWREVRAGRQ